MPRPGFVLEVDRSTPPILFHHGESLKLEKLREAHPGAQSVELWAEDEARLGLKPVMRKV